MSFCIGVCDYLVVIWYDYWCLFGTIRHGLFASLTWNLLRLSISLWNRSKKGIFNTKWSTEKWMYLQMGCKTRYHYHVRRERGVWINRDSQKRGVWIEKKDWWSPFIMIHRMEFALIYIKKWVLLYTKFRQCSRWS